MRGEERGESWREEGVTAGKRGASQEGVPQKAQLQLQLQLQGQKSNALGLLAAPQKSPLGAKLSEPAWPSTNQPAHTEGRAPLQILGVGLAPPPPGMPVRSGAVPPPGQARAAGPTREQSRQEGWLGCVQRLRDRGARRGIGGPGRADGRTGGREGAKRWKRNIQKLEVRARGPQPHLCAAPPGRGGLGVGPAGASGSPGARDGGGPVPPAPRVSSSASASTSSSRAGSASPAGNPARSGPSDRAAQLSLKPQATPTHNTNHAPTNTTTPTSRAELTTPPIKRPQPHRATPL